MKRLRLLVVGPSLTGGGAERFTSTILSHLDRDRFDPSLCLMRGQIDYPLPDDVPVEVIGKSKPWHTPGAVLRLRSFIRKERPDLILSVMESVAWMVEVGRIGTTSPWRHVARSTISPGGYLPGLDRLVLPLTRALIHRADLLITNSRASTGEIASHYRVAISKVRGIPNPIDIERAEALAKTGSPASSAEGTLSIVFVGRLNPQKRPDVMLRAFAKVVKNRKTVLRILGDGPLRPRMERLAKELGITNDVEFLGFQENPYRWMAQSDLFVLTSDSEGLPNALIEAQSLGVAAVSTRCPTGPDEIIEDGVTGLLVPPGEVSAVASAMDALLADPIRRKRMGRAAKKKALRDFDVSTVMKSLERLLEELALGGPRGGASRSSGQPVAP